MIKAILKRNLRNLGIINIADKFRFQFIKIQNRGENKKFRKEFPNVPIPPNYILYESHHLNYRAYISNGLNRAKKLKALFEKHIDLKDKKVLDWGCSPSRIVRHFPGISEDTEFYGIDYNPESISWNKKNIKNVIFFKNEINPPTQFKNEFFDAIYGLSVFTHLSAENHINWIEELYRITHTNSILILSSHGEIFKQKLLKQDQLKFDSNELVIHGNTLEGHRTYAAYHPPTLMRTLFEKRFQVLEHIPGKKVNWGLSQDVWILKK